MVPQPPVPRPSISTLERELRALLADGRLSLRQADMRDVAGKAHLENGVVSVDPFHGGYLELVVHELLHFRTHGQLGALEELIDEAVVLYLEDRVVRHINNSRRRQSWWRASIAAKLEVRDE